MDIGDKNELHIAYECWCV